MPDQSSAGPIPDRQAGVPTPSPVLYQPNDPLCELCVLRGKCSSKARKLKSNARLAACPLPASARVKSIMATLRQQIATNVLTVTRFRELMRKLRENRPNDDLDLVKKAYEFSLKHHAGQSRASGQPYLVHPLEVGNVLADMKMDSVSIAAGLLHDSVEDTSVTTVEIRQEFGEQVAHIVEGVTKISKIDFSSKEEAQAENLRKMMLAMVDDIRVVLIKLADRLHNMRTLEHLDPERQQKIARETLDIYAPIAHRLGMGKIRGELEDLGFKHVDPIGYEQVL